MINFSDNISRLRRERKITQEQLADFVGVTKASVSKWETGLSLPDVLILPRIASFFDVTIDELLGYKPQLSKEQIEKLYAELSGDFANKAFDEVMKRCRLLVRQYYSCYSFLLQMAVLWLNHFMLSEDKEAGMGVLEEAAGLCRHIIDNCKEIGLCNDAVAVNAMIDLYLGKAEEVIEVLEETQNPMRLSTNGDSVLIQAYQMMGDIEKAKDYTQISLYNHLLSMIGMSISYLTLYGDDFAKCETTILRVEKLAEAYALEKLNPGNIILFWYQAAIVYATSGNRQRTLEMLGKYVNIMDYYIKKEDLTLHGDDYFDRLDMWIEKLDLKGNAPRDMKVIYESALTIFGHPAFSTFSEDEDFIKLQESLIRKGEKYE